MGKAGGRRLWGPQNGRLKGGQLWDGKEYGWQTKKNIKTKVVWGIETRHCYVLKEKVEGREQKTKGKKIIIHLLGSSTNPWVGGGLYLGHDKICHHSGTGPILICIANLMVILCRRHKEVFFFLISIIKCKTHESER